MWKSIRGMIAEYGTFLAILAVGAAVIATMVRSGIGGGSHPLSGKRAPSFELETLAGERVALADHQGKDVVVLDFFATWCPPCRAGLPKIDKVADDYAAPDDGVAVYAVNIMEGPELIREFMTDQGLSLTVLLDGNSVTASEYGAQSIPQTVVIDKAGMVRTVHRGVIAESTLRRDIQAAQTPLPPTDGAA